MIIKKFQAKTENEAVEAAKKELGANVVIMNVKTVKRKGLFAFLKAPMTEVTVALEEENERQIRQAEVKPQSKPPVPTPQPENRPTMTALERLSVIPEADKKAGSSSNTQNSAIEEKLDQLQTLLQQNLEAKDDEGKETSNESTTESDEDADETMKFMKLLYNVMIDNEVNEKYANQIIEDAEKNQKPGMPFDYALTNIYQKMILKFGQPKMIEKSDKGPRVVFFVGPTGVGKTTTIAKIASKFSLEQKAKVALLTADTYRIAAAEQLRTYANILEVPFRIVYSGQEILQAYEEFKEYDYILIDTAGHSHHNEEQKENSKIMIHSLDGIAEAEVYLVLSATTKYRDLVSIADTYKEMANFKMIFTKLDETTSLGNLLNLKLYTDADLSYITCGQNVPEDIEQFDPQKTVKLILGGKA